MNSLLYAKLAKTNLSKNRQNILPYWLSCIGTVIMFYIMSTLSLSEGLKKMMGKATIQIVMQFGVYIIGLFAVIFLINYLKSLHQIHAAQPIELLHGEQEGEREPKTKLLTAWIGLICLGLGYYLALTCQNPMEALGKFFGAVLLVMAGTYCLFSAGSIALLKLLKSNKRYYYQTRHFTSISGMLYRMKQNAMGLANICILSTGVLLVISTTSCLWFGMQEIIQTRFPHQIAVEVNDTLMSANGDGTALTKEEISSVREQINNYLEEQQVSKRFERDETYW